MKITMVALTSLLLCGCASNDMMAVLTGKTDVLTLMLDSGKDNEVDTLLEQGKVGEAELYISRQTNEYTREQLKEQVAADQARTAQPHEQAVASLFSAEVPTGAWEPEIAEQMEPVRAESVPEPKTPVVVKTEPQAPAPYRPPVRAEPAPTPKGDAQSVVGKTYRWKQMVEGTMCYMEYTFLADSQYTRATWIDENTPGKIANPILEHGAWKQSGNEVMIQMLAPGGYSYPAQWVYPEITYVVSKDRLTVKSYRIHDRRKIYESGVPDRVTFLLARPVAPGKFSAYCREPYKSPLLRNQLDFAVFKTKTMDAHPYEWRPLN